MRGCPDTDALGDKKPFNMFTRPCLSNHTFFLTVFPIHDRVYPLQASSNGTPVEIIGYLNLHSSNFSVVAFLLVPCSNQE